MDEYFLTGGKATVVEENCSLSLDFGYLRTVCRKQQKIQIVFIHTCTVESLSDSGNDTQTILYISQAPYTPMS
jgi:hypothetical protein